MSTITVHWPSFLGGVGACLAFVVLCVVIMFIADEE